MNLRKNYRSAKNSLLYVKPYALATRALRPKVTGSKNIAHAWKVIGLNIPLAERYRIEHCANNFSHHYKLS